MKNKVKFSQDMEINVKRTRDVFPVDLVDWERLKGMISNYSPAYNAWASISLAGFTTSLAIILAWITVKDGEGYSYKTELLIAAGMSLVVGIMSGIFAWSKKKSESFSRKQILQEMDTMQASMISEAEVTENEDELEPIGELEIINATYGIDEEGKIIDVTDKLKSLVANGELKLIVGNFLVEGNDPAPGIVKFLRVEYSYNGLQSSIRIKESDQLSLPV